MLQNHIEFESTSHVMSRDYCDLATAKVHCKSKLQKRTVELKSELQKKTEKVNCRRELKK